MRRINDPIALRDCLSRLFDGTHLTVAQARLLLASRGIRAPRKTVEAALKLPALGGQVAKAPKPQPRPRLKPLDDLPLTPKEREIMERLRREPA
ncbi:hypothetical protein [Meiothermus sp. CFH 77666]|uniref:hypothetical protein n=1 Tax=Meiothermus sp. CFH 77666 TaxID=2817942 RepID=UPI001AA0A712|nr:hypothetical protein [Meiothermus sp. CFH 77666]MBO1438614.1 hypothetical protein [Meiothermus sp. CFH 77666]